MNDGLRRFVAYVTTPRKRTEPTLAYTVTTTLLTLSAIWAVTGVMAFHAYRVFELENYGAIAITPAHVTHLRYYRGARLADYVFPAPQSGATITGKGEIEMREASELSIGQSATIDVAFLRANPEVNAPISYVLGDPTNDELLPMLFASFTAILSIALLRPIWKAIRLRRHEGT